MSHTKTTLRSRVLKTIASGLGVIVLAAGIGTCSAQDATTADTQADRAEKLDAKLSAVKDQFRSLKAKLTDASAQAKTNLSAELEVASRDLAKAFEEREAAYEISIQKFAESLDAKWKELEEQGELTTAEAAEKLDRLRQSWNESYEQLRQSNQERVEHYRSELTAIEKQVTEASNELNEEWIARRTAARKQYEATAASMRESYQESIVSLEKEIDRLRTGATKASDENNAKFAAMADSLSGQMNVLHQELQTSYRETAEKADRYLDQNQGENHESKRRGKKQS